MKILVILKFEKKKKKEHKEQSPEVVIEVS